MQIIRKEIGEKENSLLSTPGYLVILNVQRNPISKVMIFR